MSWSYILWSAIHSIFARCTLAFSLLRLITILSLPTIKEYLLSVDLIPLIEERFVSLSSRQAIVPHVGELLFDNPKGKHISNMVISNINLKI